MSREADNSGEVRVRLAAEAQSVGQARRLVRNVLQGSTAEAQRVNDALLVASELVSNAISHGSRQGEIDVQFTLVGSTLLLCVVDSARADAVPHLRGRDPTRAARRAVQAELDL